MRTVLFAAIALLTALPAAAQDFCSKFPSSVACKGRIATVDLRTGATAGRPMQQHQLWLADQQRARNGGQTGCASTGCVTRSANGVTIITDRPTGGYRPSY